MYCHEGQFVTLSLSR